MFQFYPAWIHQMYEPPPGTSELQPSLWCLLSIPVLLSGSFTPLRDVFVLHVSPCLHRITIFFLEVRRGGVNWNQLEIVFHLHNADVTLVFFLPCSHLLMSRFTLILCTCSYFWCQTAGQFLDVFGTCTHLLTSLWIFSCIVHIFPQTVMSISCGAHGTSRKFESKTPSGVTGARHRTLFSIRVATVALSGRW